MQKLESITDDIRHNFDARTAARDKRWRWPAS